MYKIVSFLLGCSVLLQTVSIFRALSRPDIMQYGLKIPAWPAALAGLPSLIVVILAFVLVQQKNACAFWAYFVLTIISVGVAVQTVSTAWFLAGGSNRLNLGDFVSDLGVWIIVASLALKVIICCILWHLIQRGVLAYSRTLRDIDEKLAND